jgi:cell division protein FtsB
MKVINMHPMGMSVYFDLDELKKENRKLKREVKELKNENAELRFDLDMEEGIF